MNKQASAILSTLKAHREQRMGSTISDLFAADADRFAKRTTRCGDILFDWSKTAIDDAALTGLLDLARAADVEPMRARLFAGDAINLTEGRAVQHMSLRAPADATIMIDGRNVVPDVQAVLATMTTFADGVRSGTITGAGGAFTDIVNIGIGGSDLGPAMATAGPAPSGTTAPRTHFVSNVDGADIAETSSGSCRRQLFSSLPPRHSPPRKP